MQTFGFSETRFKCVLELLKILVILRVQTLLFHKAPQALDWLFILHLDCVARRNDCTISAMPIIIIWLYGTPNGCSVEPDRLYIARL